MLCWYCMDIYHQCDDKILSMWYQDIVSVMLWCCQSYVRMMKYKLRMMSLCYHDTGSVIVWCYKCYIMISGCCHHNVRMLYYDVSMMSVRSKDSVSEMSGGCQYFVSMLSVLGAVSVQSLLKYSYSMLLMNWQNTSSLQIASKCVLILPWL